MNLQSHLFELFAFPSTIVFFISALSQTQTLLRYVTCPSVPSDAQDSLLRPFCCDPHQHACLFGLSSFSNATINYDLQQKKLLTSTSASNQHSSLHHPHKWKRSFTIHHHSVDLHWMKIFSLATFTSRLKLTYPVLRSRRLQRANRMVETIAWKHTCCEITLERQRGDKSTAHS